MKSKIKSPESLLVKAVTSFRHGDTSEAIDLIQTAYAEQPNLIDGYAQLGGICRELRLWEQACSWMERDYTANRMSLAWQLRYADVLAELDQWDDAENVVASAYKACPDATDGYARLGATFIRRNQWDQAREWMERDVTAERMSPFWRLHYARVLGAFGETKKAEHHVDSVLQKIGTNHFSCELLIFACQTLLRLNPYRDVSTILDRGLDLYPEYQDRLLVDIAEMTFGVAISRWLLLQSTQFADNIIKNKLTGSSADSYRPYWARVVQYHDRALAAGVDMGEKNVLRKMVIARLFASHEMDRNITPTGHSNSLDSWTRAFPKLQSLKFLRFIAHTVADKVQGQISKQDASGQISSALSGCSDGLSSAEWLGLNEVLIWHGFFICGYQAWEHSIAQAYVEAETAKDLYSLNNAFCAAMMVADYDRAGRYLNYLHDSNALAYLLIHQGRIEEACAYWRSRPSDTDPVLAERLGGKTIAIVGPAPTGERVGAEIDRHDIVIRTCYTGRDMNSDEFGFRTTASNYPGHHIWQWGQGADRSYLADLEWYSFDGIWPPHTHLIADIKRRRAFKLLDNKFFYFKDPNAIQRILFDVMRFAPRKTKLFKTNFFLANQLYRSGYNHLPNSSSIEHSQKDRAFRQSVLFAHDLACQLAFVRNLWKAGVVDVDNACRQVLQLSNDEYMRQMDLLYGS